MTQETPQDRFRQIRAYLEQEYGPLDQFESRMQQQIENMHAVEARGGNKFQQLEARLTNATTGRWETDIVIHAIQTLKTPEDIRSFIEGYAANIAAHPDKYPPQARGRAKDYAIYDTFMALGMHFTNPETHGLWNPVLDSYQEATP